VFAHVVFISAPCGRGGLQCPLLARGRRPPPTSTLNVLFPHPPALQFPGTTFLVLVRGVIAHETVGDIRCLALCPGPLYPHSPNPPPALAVFACTYCGLGCVGPVGRVGLCCLDLLPLTHVVLITR